MLDDSRCADGADETFVRRNADLIAARAHAVREDVGEIFIIMRRVFETFDAGRARCAAARAFAATFEPDAREARDATRMNV